MTINFPISANAPFSPSLYYTPPIERDEGRSSNWPSRVFFFFANGLGRRPALLAALVFLSGSWLTWRLWASVMHHESVGDRVVMLSVITVTWVLLLARLRSTDKYLRSAVRAFYRKVADNSEGRRKLRLIVEELQISENSPHKLLSLIRWMPAVFLMLVLVLSVLGNALWLAGECGLMAEGLMPRIFPWAVLVAGVGYMIGNDIEIGKNLVLLLSQIPSGETLVETTKEQVAAHGKAFFQTLSKRQQEVAVLRYEQQKTLREIASELYISVATVHTHINDVNKLYRNFLEERPAAEGLTLWDFFQKK